MTQPKPQRISPPSLPGELLKRALETKQQAQRFDDNERDPTYLAMVRSLVCLKCGMDPAGVAAHVRMNSGLHNKHGGMAKKPADKWALPLCGSCHQEQHKIGEREFWYLLGLEPLLICTRLWAQRGDLLAMRMVVQLAIAGRSKS